MQGVAWGWESHGNEPTMVGTPPPLSALVRPADAEPPFASSEAADETEAEAGGYAVWRHSAARVETVASATSELQATLRPPWRCM